MVTSILIICAHIFVSGFFGRDPTNLVGPECDTEENFPAKRNRLQIIKRYELPSKSPMRIQFRSPVLVKSVDFPYSPRPRKGVSPVSGRGPGYQRQIMRDALQASRSVRKMYAR